MKHVVCRKSSCYTLLNWKGLKWEISAHTRRSDGCFGMQRAPGNLRWVSMTEGGVGGHLSKPLREKWRKNLNLHFPIFHQIVWQIPSRLVTEKLLKERAKTSGPSCRVSSLSSESSNRRIFMRGLCCAKAECVCLFKVSPRRARQSPWMAWGGTLEHFAI